MLSNDALCNRSSDIDFLYKAINGILLAGPIKVDGKKLNRREKQKESKFLRISIEVLV